MARPDDDLLLSALLHLANEAGDLSLCPYYRGTGTCFQMGVCSYSMGMPEPQCQTCVPSDEGWPLEHHSEVRAWLIEQIEAARGAAQEGEF